GLSPTALLEAYNANPLAGAGFTGQGATIVFFEVRGYDQGGLRPFAGSDGQKWGVNARPTVEGDGAYEKIGQLFEAVDRQFPGAVWSLSIGWGCDALVSAADLAPAESALATAQKHGTSAFDASGDTAGLECKGGDEWSSPPGPDDVGLDAVSSLPAMTSVGGTPLA